MHAALAYDYTTTHTMYTTKELDCDMLSLKSLPINPDAACIPTPKISYPTMVDPCHEIIKIFHILKGRIFYLEDWKLAPELDDPSRRSRK